jgi:hypothetical protein
MSTRDQHHFATDLDTAALPSECSEEPEASPTAPELPVALERLSRLRIVTKSVVCLVPICSIG